MKPCPHLSITTSSKIITSRKSVVLLRLTLATFIPFRSVQELPQNLSVSVNGKYEKLGGKLGFSEKQKTEKKSLVKHINIYMEKSLKQREQLKGYLRDKLLEEKKEEDE